MKCQFHPLREANNHCPICEKYFCHDCSDEAKVGRDVEGDACCYVCGQRMQALISSSDIESFWHRLNDIYRYPLSSNAIITIVVIAVVNFIFSNFGLFAILPVAALHLYSFACLRETAGGQLTAPSVSVCFEQSLAPLFYVVISAVCAQFLTILAFGALGTGVGIIVAGFFMMALPAMIILIAIEESLASAVNPGRLMSVMKATGSSYFVMLLFIVVMWSSMALIISLFNKLDLPTLTLVMQSLITSYYTIIIYHIMGYLVYQNQETLGHTVENTNRPLASSVGQSDKQLAAKFEFMVKLGNFKEARNIARLRLNRSDLPLWEWDRAFRLYCSGTPKSEAYDYFKKYIEKLKSQEEIGAIADAYMALKKAMPDLTIDDWPRRILIAEALNEYGKYRSAIKLVHSYKNEIEDQSMVTRALVILSESSAKVSGREKQAEHYKKLLALHKSVS